MNSYCVLAFLFFVLAVVCILVGNFFTYLALPFVISTGIRFLVLGNK